MFAVATQILLWMIRASIVLIGLNLFSVLIGLLVRRVLVGCILVLVLSTWLWAATFTLWCALQVLAGWGLFAMLIGLFLGIVGIIPDALLCLVATRQWVELLQFAFQLGLVLSGWSVARWLIEMSE